MNSNAKPITKKEEVKESPDNKIDEDFKGYPHGHSKDERSLNPKLMRRRKLQMWTIKMAKKGLIKEINEVMKRRQVILPRHSWIIIA